jgi:hypothetical protein
MRDDDGAFLSVLAVGLLVLLVAMAATGRLERLTASIRALTASQPPRVL